MLCKQECLVLSRYLSSKGFFATIKLSKAQDRSSLSFREFSQSISYLKLQKFLSETAEDNGVNVRINKNNLAFGLAPETLASFFSCGQITLLGSFSVYDGDGSDKVTF